MFQLEARDGPFTTRILGNPDQDPMYNLRKLWYPNKWGGEGWIFTGFSDIKSRLQ